MIYPSRFLQRAWFKHVGYGWRKDLKRKNEQENEDEIRAHLIEQAIGSQLVVNVGVIGIGIVVGIHRVTYSIMPEWLRYKGDINYERQKNPIRIPEVEILVSIDTEMTELLTHPSELVRNAAKQRVDSLALGKS